MPLAMEPINHGGEVYSKLLGPMFQLPTPHPQLRHGGPPHGSAHQEGDPVSMGA